MLVFADCVGARLSKGGCRPVPAFADQAPGAFASAVKRWPPRVFPGRGLRRQNLALPRRTACAMSWATRKAGEARSLAAAKGRHGMELKGAVAVVTGGNGGLGQ